MSEEDNTDEESEKTGEPRRMSWYVFAFMSMCLVMTSAMAYYAWEIFARYN